MCFCIDRSSPKVNGITFGNNGRNFLNLCCQFVKTSRRERENVPRKDNLFYTNVHAALHERSRRGLYICPREVTHIYVGIINFCSCTKNTSSYAKKR